MGTLHDAISDAREWPQHSRPSDWPGVETWLSAHAPGPEMDVLIDALADEVLAAGTGPEVVPVLLRAVGLAEGDLTRRAAALALAASASADDRETVDTLVAAYHAAMGNAFLGPALLEALGSLATAGGLARAVAVVELIRIDRTGNRYLLIKAAKMIGLLDAIRPEPDLRGRLHDWSQTDDLAVQGEARQQLALVALADALLATASTALRESLADARAAFARAEASEEHRPDASLFKCLLDMLLALWGLADNPSMASAGVGANSSAIRGLLMDLSRHDWHGYRSPRADVVAARVLATATALERAADSARHAEQWLQLDQALEELVALYLVIRESGNGTATDRHAAGLAAIADTVLVPALGPVLRRAVGRVRLDAILRNYVARNGADAVSDGLAILIQEAGDDEHGPLGVETERDLIRLASLGGVTPQALVSGLRDAIEKDDLNDWAGRQGLTPVTLPVDLPGLYGKDPNVDETIRTLLRDLRIRLGHSYPRHTWDQLIVVLESVVRFARHTRNALPDYMCCAEDGGKGRDATERDLQDDLFRWLDQRFGPGATYERTKIGGGRSDTGVVLDGCSFPIEVKHEYEDVSRPHLRESYVIQTDRYAAASDRVAVLVILDLRESHASGHRRHPKLGLLGKGAETVSLYSLREGFWLDSLMPDSQIEGAMEKPIIVGLFPGNQVRPSGTTKYSRRRNNARSSQP